MNGKFKKALIKHLKSGDVDFEYNGLSNGDEDNDDQWIMTVSARPFDKNNKEFIPYVLKSDPYWIDGDEEEREEYTEQYESYMEEGIPTHIVRFVTRNQFWSTDQTPLVLVDGTQYYVVFDEENNTIKSIWEDAWEGNQPDYYGGPIDGAMEWCRECGEIFYMQFDNPFLKVQGTVDNGGYPPFVKRDDITMI